MKKVVIILVCSFFFLQTQVIAKPSYTTHLNKGLKQLNEQKYTPAIESFTKAVKLAPDNLQTRVSLAKAYITRADIYFDKDKEFGKAANDYRCALFYLEYLEPVIIDSELEKLIIDAETKLNLCCKKLHFKKTCENRYNTAELLKIAEIYPAAVYEYNKAAKDKNLTEKCNKKISEVLKLF